MIMAVTVMIPTPLDGMGLVAHGGTNCRKIKLTSNSQLNQNTIHCTIEATDHLISKVNLNLVNMTLVVNPSKKSYREQ